MRSISKEQEKSLRLEKETQECVEYLHGHRLSQKLSMVWQGEEGQEEKRSSKKQERDPREQSFTGTCTVSYREVDSKRSMLHVSRQRRTMMVMGTKPGV